MNYGNGRVECGIFLKNEYKEDTVDRCWGGNVVRVPRFTHAQHGQTVLYGEKARGVDICPPTAPCIEQSGVGKCPPPPAPASAAGPAHAPVLVPARPSSLSPPPPYTLLPPNTILEGPVKVKQCYVSEPEGTHWILYKIAFKATPGGQYEYRDRVPYEPPLQCIAPKTCQKSGFIDAFCA